MPNPQKALDALEALTFKDEFVEHVQKGCARWRESTLGRTRMIETKQEDLQKSRRNTWAKELGHLPRYSEERRARASEVFDEEADKWLAAQASIDELTNHCDFTLSTDKDVRALSTDALCVIAALAWHEFRKSSALFPESDPTFFTEHRDKWTPTLDVTIELYWVVNRLATEFERSVGNKRKTKKSTARGDALVKITSALNAHHAYGHDESFSPIGVGELARTADVAKSTVSEFFGKVFGGHSKYKRMCRREEHKLRDQLASLNDESRTYGTFGQEPLQRVKRQEDE